MKNIGILIIKWRNPSSTSREMFFNFLRLYSRLDRVKDRIARYTYSMLRYLG